MSKLPNAPLQEVVFEVRWQLQPDDSGKQLIDSEYAFALGKFEASIAGDFPHRTSKFPDEVPHQLLNYQTVHQFWRGEGEWPVVQIGPGIMSVNDTDKNYDWQKTYLPLVKLALSALMKSYHQLNFISASLRYIDVVRVADYGFDTWEAFVRQNINFSFENRFDPKGKLTAFQFNQSFEQNKTGLTNVNFSSGKNGKEEDVFIFQTAVVQNKKMNEKEVIDWLQDAHNYTSSLFKDICKDEFYNSFTRA